jgi:hypothetical protein
MLGVNSLKPKCASARERADVIPMQHMRKACSTACICDFILWVYMKDAVFAPQLPTDILDLK